MRLSNRKPRQGDSEKLHAYLNPMLPDDELKRLRWRATHRGTREADMLVGGFFEAHHAGWTADERATFAGVLREGRVANRYRLPGRTRGQRFKCSSIAAASFLRSGPFAFA